MATEGTQRVTVHGDREVVVAFDPDLTFDCVDGCTWCCHRGVRLSERDSRELSEHVDPEAATAEHDGDRFVKREEKDRPDHVDVDGAACYFLRGDGLCGLHAEHDWKPARCSLFPLAVSVDDGDLRVSVREDARAHCDGLDVGERRVIDNLEAFLPAALWELDDLDTGREP